MFNSKKEFALALLNGRKFRDPGGFFIYFDNESLGNPFRVKINGKNQGLDGIWGSASEVKEVYSEETKREKEKIMIKVTGYEQENQGSIDIKEISTTTPIFVKKGEKLIGVLTKETAGWIIRTSNGGGVSGYFLSREKTLSSASEIGPYSFFILN